MTSQFLGKIILLGLMILVLALAGFYFSLNRYGRFWEGERKPAEISKEISSPSPSPRLGQPLPFLEGVVDNLGENSLRVKGDKEAKEFLVDQETEYFFLPEATVGAKPQKITEKRFNLLEPGRKVNVAYRLEDQAPGGKTRATAVLIIGK